METAILHYGAFKDFLATHLAREQANGSRTNARDKLTRLTKNQFQELSTDVYDELTRRLMDSNEVPFLPLRDDFHPKRNQARQKLATLPKNRFKDLASDVYYELERRFPDLKDMDFSQRIDNKQSQPPSSSQPTYQQPLSSPPNPQSYQTNNKIQTQKNPSDFASSQAPNKNNIVPEISTLKQEVVDFTIQKQNSKSEMSNINGGIDDGPKPYTLKNGSSTNIGNNNIPNNYPPPPEYGSPMSPSSRTQSSASSVSDFGRRYMNVTSVSSISSTSSNPKNRDTVGSQRNKNDPSNYASLDTLMADFGDMIDNKQIDGNVNNNGYSPKQSPVIGYNTTSEIEKIRSDYELKIATLQKKIKDLDLELSSVKKLGPTASNGKLADLQQQLDEQIRINKQQATKISQLEDDYYRLNEEHKIQQECTNDVQKEASTLLEEIKNLSKRNDELILEKEEDVAKISSLTSEMNEWKSKYEKTKTELRNLKATSSFYKEAPKMNIVNDHGIKPTPDGAIDESKIVSYQVAIDDLLRAGRSEDPTNVLLAMKSIVISCKDITEEVELYEKNKGSLMKAENQEKLTQIKTGLSTTLTNLMTAAKNHATGAGLSPVSLLDAAASHLTVAVVEVAKHLKLRRSPNDRTQDRDKKSSMTNGRSRGVGTEDLKDFLERQTEAIVQAIQTLLANIRNGSYGSYGGSIIEKINTIITILLNVIAVCNDSFEENPGTTYRTRGSTLLRELETCIEKMEEMRSLIENNDDFASDKASKQRLASVAFEIAKLTKELHGLVGK